MGDLKESRMICKGLIFFFLPVILFGGLSMFFPVVYAIFPVQESRMCICSFFEYQGNDNQVFWLDLNDESFRNLEISN